MQLMTFTVIRYIKARGIKGHSSDYWTIVYRILAICALCKISIVICFVDRQMANVEKLVKSLEVLRTSHGTSGNDDFSLK